MGRQARPLVCRRQHRLSNCLDRIAPRRPWVGLAPSVDGAIAVYPDRQRDPGWRLRAGRGQRYAIRGRSRNRRAIGTCADTVSGSIRAAWPAFSASGWTRILIALLIADASADARLLLHGGWSCGDGLLLSEGRIQPVLPACCRSSREDSDCQVAVVARVTLDRDSCIRHVLDPSRLGDDLHWSCPHSARHSAPLLVLLPGVVALSGSNVVGSYLRGIGRPGLPSLVSLMALAVNIVANLVPFPVGDRGRGGRVPWFCTPFRRSRCR